MIRTIKMILLASLLVVACASAYGTAVYAEDPAPNWQLIEPVYESHSTFVAAYSANDFGAVGDSETDVTATLQQLLDSLGRLGGGTLFLPEGHYVIRGNLNVPKGVSMRGEWKKPVKGEPVQGTILMAYAGRDDAEAPAFITMETSSSIRDLAIWYPEQEPDSIVPYPPAVLLGKPNVWGNENTNVFNITLVNTYNGIQFSHTNGGTSPTIQNIYGTPLKQGIEIDNIVDVGRIDWVDFSPAYWAGSGLPGSPAVGSSFEQWIYDNGTGILMRRNDWSYSSYITVDGYNIGFHAASSISSPGAMPNGHNYDLHIKNSKTGIYFDGVSGVGIMFTNVALENVEDGIMASSEQEGTLQLYGCSIDASGRAIFADATSKTKLMMRECMIEKGSVTIEGGTFIASDNDFENGAPHISLGEESRAIVTSNRFNGEPSIDDKTKYISVIDHAPVEFKKLPAFPVMEPKSYKPARAALYVVTEAPFLAKGDGQSDDTQAIQSALDAAGAEGGGVVFVPPGKFKVLSNLVVPTGVELKGSLDSGTVPTGKGSVIEVYAGRGNADGEPFLKLEQGSGVRALTFDYPEQIMPEVAAYPYLMQALGSDVYIINIGMRATYNGIDLFSHRADRHYVDYAAGHVFRNGIKVGGGSKDGVIRNLQYNPLPYAAGNESKYGSWPNSPRNDADFQAVYSFGYDNLDFLVLGDAQDQILYNVFHFGSARGMVLAEENGKGPSGISLGLGVDGAKKSVVIESAAPEGFEFINTQIVTIGEAEDRRYLETTSSFTGEVTFYSSDYWGSPINSLVLDNGTVHMLMAHFENAGQRGFSVLNEGKLHIDNSIIRSANPLVNKGMEQQLFVQSSIADSIGIVWKDAALWKHTLANIMVVAPKSQSADTAGEPVAQPSEQPTSPAEAVDAASRSSDAIIWISLAVVAVAAGVAIFVFRNKKKDAAATKAE